MDAIEKFVKGKDFTPYRKEYNTLTGCVKASLLLQQIAYIWLSNKRQPFYKFRAPCKHDAYKVGDSWVEIMGFTDDELDGAIKKLLKKEVLFCKTNAARMTRYTLNEVVLNDYLESVSLAANPEKSDYLNPKSRIRKTDKVGLGNTEKSDYIIPKSPFTLDSTEIDTEIDTEIEEGNFANFRAAGFEEEVISLGAKEEENPLVAPPPFFLEAEKVVATVPLEKEKKVAAKKEKVVVVPSFEEFAAHGQEVFKRIEVPYSLIWAEVIRSKYERWVSDGWKIAAGRPIANWKNTLSNVITAKVLETNSRNNQKSTKQNGSFISDYTQPQPQSGQPF